MTTFRGHKTGFNKTGKNDCVPNEAGPPATKFTGRGAAPNTMKLYPGGVANISDGNRRLAKTKHGDGGGSGTSFSTLTAFGSPRKGKK